MWMSLPFCFRSQSYFIPIHALLHEDDPHPSLGERNLFRDPPTGCWRHRAGKRREIQIWNDETVNWIECGWRCFGMGSWRDEDPLLVCFRDEIGWEHFVVDEAVSCGKQAGGTSPDDFEVNSCRDKSYDWSYLWRGNMQKKLRWRVVITIIEWRRCIYIFQENKWSPLSYSQGCTGNIPYSKRGRQSGKGTSAICSIIMEY